MLVADDVSAIKAIAEQTADALTSHGMRSLLARMMAEDAATRDRNAGPVPARDRVNLA